MTRAFSFIKGFAARHYLAVTFFISLAIAIVLTVLIFTELRTDKPEPAVLANALSFMALVVAIGVLTTWPRWFFAKWNAMVQRAVGPLGASNEKPNKDFEKRAGAAFGPELVSNVFSYEDYCKNEYIQDMRKHYVAWIQLAVSGLITIGAALLVIFSRSEGDVKWIEAVGVTLPALVTGVLLKIWLETRDNLDKTRQRTDTIYRQRIRLLLLTGNHSKGSKLPDSIALNRQILDYINRSESGEAAPAEAVAPATRT
jgi:hypothetical protein